MRRSPGLCFTVLLFSLPGCARSPREESVLLFADSSTGSALQGLARDFQEESGIAVQLHLAASPVLARLIESGDPADVLLAAHPRWLAELEGKGRLEPGSRRLLLGNRLALAAAGGSDGPAWTGWRDAAAYFAAHPGCIALAEPGSAALGAYSRDALLHLGLWEVLEERFSFAADALAARWLVVRGECAFGVLYESDTAGSSSLAVVSPFPAESHEPIRYELAVLRGRGTPPVRRLAEYLRGPGAAAAFAGHGFTVLAEASR